MAQRRSSPTPRLPSGLGPFAYAFRPSPAGEDGTILIRGPGPAPLPARGDLLILTTQDCYDADFEVTDVVLRSSGWWVGCQRKRSA